MDRCNRWKTYTCQSICKDTIRYYDRKDYPIQNILTVCTFDLKFTYVLVGWKGFASNSRIIKNTLTRSNIRIRLIVIYIIYFKLSHLLFIFTIGKYYLVDVGFMLTSGLITSYRRVQYHLTEYLAKNSPQNYKELFNHWHSSLRNAIERAYDVLKKRFEILSNLK